MKPAKSKTRKIVGWALIIIGLIGLFLPLLQGVLLIGIGLAIVENEAISGLFKRLRTRLKSFRKHKKAGKAKFK